MWIMRHMPEMDKGQSHVQGCGSGPSSSARTSGSSPAANTAEGTPIYGMPILDVDAAKISLSAILTKSQAMLACPIRFIPSRKFIMDLGTPPKTVSHLADLASGKAKPEPPRPDSDTQLAKALQDAKRVIIVCPGMVWPLQAQHQVKKLADAPEARGAKGRLRHSSCRGRMLGGHIMCYLQANVDYEHMLRNGHKVNPMVIG